MPRKYNYNALLFLSLFLVLVAGCGGPYSPMLVSQWNALKRTTLYSQLDETDTLGGIDENGNGVRDDIENWAKQQNYTPMQLKAVLYASMVLRETLFVDLSDQNTVMKQGIKHSRSIDCLFDVFPNEPDSEISRVLEAANANTRKRTDQYIKYNSALSGGVFRMAESACNDMDGIEF